ARPTSQDDRSPAHIRGLVPQQDVAPGAAPDIEPTAVVEPLQLERKSGASTLGWVLLVLVLLGGGVALVYVMLVQNADKGDPRGVAPDHHATQPVSASVG